MRAVLPFLLALTAAWPARAQAPPKTPGAPPASTDAYDARVRQSFAAAESFQGPLDGGWTLSGPHGALFAIEFSDGEGRLEAAWRDLRRPGALNASGFLEAAERAGGRLFLRFSPAPGIIDTAVLAAGAGGHWSGELDEDGRRTAVTLVRTAP